MFVCVWGGGMGGAERVAVSDRTRTGSPHDELTQAQASNYSLLFFVLFFSCLKLHLSQIDALGFKNIYITLIVLQNINRQFRQMRTTTFWELI